MARLAKRGSARIRHSSQDAFLHRSPTQPDSHVSTYRIDDRRLIFAASYVSPDSDGILVGVIGRAKGMTNVNARTARRSRLAFPRNESEELFVEFTNRANDRRLQTGECARILTISIPKVKRARNILILEVRWSVVDKLRPVSE